MGVLKLYSWDLFLDSWEIQQKAHTLSYLCTYAVQGEGRKKEIESDRQGLQFTE